MSWKLFKVNMLLYMNNPIGIVTPVQFAIKLTQEYDSCMRRGGQLIGKESVLVGNIGLMTTLLTVAQAKAITKTQPGKHNFLMDVGDAIKGYWTGATLQPFPIYPIPAPGSIQNIILNSGMVTNPGQWPTTPFEIPTKSCLTFIEAFVMFAKIHLFTLQGMFMTTSLYPSVPSPIPAPGVANWVGYLIPDIPMFGLKFGSEGGDLSNSGVDISNTSNKTPGVKKKPQPIINADILSNGDADGLSQKNKEDEIDDKLISDLGSGGSGGIGGGLGNDSNLDKILEAERQKDLAGIDRFYSEAIQAIGDFKNLQPDTDAQFRKSLGDLQKELQDEKDNCCVDCD
jgi:hypothetical protein